MARNPIDPGPLISFLQREKIASLDQLKQVLRTSGTMTVFRKLKAMGYRSSYSHRGKYYTLLDIPEFDQKGLWSFHSVWFSRYGNLMETALELVQGSTAGYSVQELEQIVHVQTKGALLRLHEHKRLARKKISEVFIYFSNDPDRQRRQRYRREEAQPPGLDHSILHELKAAIVLFSSLLDEKQRRLSAGLEAFRLGHGGEQKIADLLGIDRHTVARGQRELLEAEISTHRVRQEGGGRKPREKKRRKSWSESKRS